MMSIQQAVSTWLEAQKLAVVAETRSPARIYPVLVVNAELSDSTLCFGGKLTEQRYQVRITAAADRERAGNTALLSALVPPLLRGIPWGERTLHPLHLQSQGDELQFELSVCIPVPEETGTAPEGTHTMGQLHFLSLPNTNI